MNWTNQKIHSKALLPLVLLLFTCQSQWCHGENILFFFGLSTYSHRITAWPLAVKLAEKGHNVTFLQSVDNKNPHPKVTEMKPTNFKHRMPPNFFELRLKIGSAMPLFLEYTLPNLGIKICKELLNSSENVDWINSQKFDLVVIDALYNDCGYGLAYKWKAKTVVFGTTHAYSWFPDSFGFPDESSWLPSVRFAQNIPLGFFGRVLTTLGYLLCYANKELRGYPGLDLILREKFNMSDMPAVSDLIRNTSLVLINTHFSEEVARSLPPMVVPVGGMHVSEAVKPLPKEMEQFINVTGDAGFIYISFGSEADMAKSPQYIQDTFFNAIGKSKARFLWRWDGERPKGMPENVMTAKWMPQQDILGHSKVKGFITHGGILSMQEAVSHGVPMIVFPIFAEQDYNAERLHRTGRGIRLDIVSLTQPQLEEALDRILTDSRIKLEMTLASRRFKDRPAKPVDTAVWWVEYILRHEDTSFLRPLAISLTWYQRRLLDVWAFLAVTILAVLYVQAKMFRKLLSYCCENSKQKRITKTKAKKTNGKDL